MSSIKICGNKDEECSLFQEATTDAKKKSELEAEFKVDAGLLDNPEAPKVREIKNLT